MVERHLEIIEMEMVKKVVIKRICLFMEGMDCHVDFVEVLSKKLKSAGGVRIFVRNVKNEDV